MPFIVLNFYENITFLTGWAQSKMQQEAIPDCHLLY